MTLWYCCNLFQIDSDGVRVLGHPVPMPLTLQDGEEKIVESSLRQIHRWVILQAFTMVMVIEMVSVDVTAMVLMKTTFSRLHKDVLCPGLKEKLNDANAIWELFEGEEENIKTVYTKYLSDHMMVRQG